MSRVIKFRAWDEQKKIFHNNFQFIKSGDGDDDPIFFVSDKQPLKTGGGKIFFDHPSFSQKLIIEQFTGLHDKHGREIYEGDIITEGLAGDIIWKGTATIDQPPAGFVYYINSLAIYNIEGLRIGWVTYLENNRQSEIYLSVFDGIHAFSGNNYEVIGNIHENLDEYS
jgi:uncharacterized phage protein (TIGR01671 family)